MLYLYDTSYSIMVPLEAAVMVKNINLNKIMKGSITNYKHKLRRGGPTATCL